MDPLLNHQERALRWSLELDHLSKWRGDRRLFNALSFQLREPILHIKGTNGSGKTTLLKIICGIGGVDDGKVLWRYKNQMMSHHESSRAMAYCGHRDALNPLLSVSENMLWTLHLTTTINRQQLIEALRVNQLEHLAQQKSATLSAGQKRRVALLASKLCERDILVWDEPYANLDAQGRAWVDGLIVDHVQDGKIAVVTTHQPLGVPNDLVQTLELSA